MTASGPETTGLAKPARTPLRRLMRGTVLLALVILAILGGGFVWFISHVPATEITLNRNADGIVVMTGGASRISDAIDLLAAGHGKRLLISGVNPTTSSAEIARKNPRYEGLLRAASTSTTRRSTRSATRSRRGAGRATGVSHR